MNITLTWYNDEGEEVTHSFPAKFEVCGNCGGHGTHLHEAIRSHAYTQAEFDEAFDDSESKGEYFRNGGRYDVTCQVCKGKNVVPVVDEEMLTAIQEERFHEYQEAMVEEAQEREMDRRTQIDECGRPW